MVTPRFDKHARTAFIVACVTLLACGIGFRGAVQALRVYLKKEPVELRESFSTIPSTLGQWQAVGDDQTLDAEMVEELGTSKYLQRVYSPGGKAANQVSVHLAYYTGMIDTVPHVPDRCLVAAGFNTKTLPENLQLNLDKGNWRPDPEQKVNLATDEPYSVVLLSDFQRNWFTVRMPVGDLTLRTIEFESESRQGVRIFGGYFFIANGRATSTPEGVKRLSFDPREKYAYYCKVQFVYASNDATPEQYLSMVSDLLKELLPEVMKRLPDWAEVERRGDPASEQVAHKG